MASALGAEEGMAGFGVPVTEPPALVPDTPSAAEALLLLAPGVPRLEPPPCGVLPPLLVPWEPPCSVGRPQPDRPAAKAAATAAAEGLAP